MKRTGRRRWLLIGAILAIALITLAWRAHPSKRDVGETGSVSVAQEPVAKRVVAIRPHPIANAFATRADDSELDATSWVARAEVVIARKQKRYWGERIGTAVARSPADAWVALLAISRPGDPQAAMAAQAAQGLAGECASLRDRNLAEENFAHAAGPRPDNLVPDAWWKFTEDVTRGYRAWSRARTESCRRIDPHASEIANGILDQFMATTPERDAMLAEATYDTGREIEARREILARDQDAKARTALARALLRSDDSGLKQEGLTMLEGEDDPTGEIDALLDPYHRLGDETHPGDTELADLELERAAGLGDVSALDRIRNQFVISGHPEEAWAWALYALGLARIGCFAFDQPNASWLDEYARHAFRLEGTLTPVQIDEGLAAATAISQRWSHQAEQALDCGD